MGNPTINASSVRVSAAGLARLVGATFIFVLVLFALFWPMWHSGELKVKLGVACGDMIAQMRGQQTNNAGFTLAVAQPECWPMEEHRRPSP
jgi:hypothetical protein